MSVNLMAKPSGRHTPETSASSASIRERNTQELIFAFVGPIASGVTTAADILREELIKFGYEVRPTIRFSTFIEEDAFRVGMPREAPASSTRVDHLQTVGNKLREKFGNEYLAKKAVRNIAKSRVDDGFETVVEDAPQRPKVVRRAHIIDSLKNEAELLLLKDVYKNILIVFGVFAPDHVRRTRLLSKRVPSDEINVMISRDYKEPLDHGQQVASIFSNSDFFIRNDQSHKSALETTIKRYVEIIFQSGIHTATSDEAAMHEASAVSVRSACMSRQVGAAILDTAGQLISVGWNDVPKFGGGLYSEDDQTVSANKNDYRCFRWGERVCHNDDEKAEIEKKLFDVMRKSGVSRELLPDDVIRFAIKSSGIKSLVEYSRSIHAEMEAILSVARDARHSLKGASLYCTTYPCHGCARHIVASGIKEVIYIEPYEKSKAIPLHNDSISENDADKNHVIFKQYQGISPKHFELLFRQNSERKKNGRYIPPNPTTDFPLFTQPLDSFTAYEMLVASEIIDIEVADVGPH